MRSAIFDYIETFYNRERLHSRLGMRPPAEYEDAFPAPTDTRAGARGKTENLFTTLRVANRHDDDDNPDLSRPKRTVSAEPGELHTGARPPRDDARDRPNAVTPSRIAPNAVNSDDVEDGSLMLADIHRGQVPQGATGERGSQGSDGLPGSKGDTGATGPQGPPGTSVAGQSCADGQSVTGFDESGNVICSEGCPSGELTFHITSSPVDTLERWPGGTQTQDSGPNCSLTVSAPSGLISLIGGTVGADAWEITSVTGWTSAIGSVQQPICKGVASVAAVMNNRPYCSNASVVGASGPSENDFVVTVD